MTAASIPLSYLSNKTAVKPSPIHGQGLFAIAPIRKGETVCIKGGHIFTREHLTEMNARLGPAEIPITDDLFIGPVTEEERNGSIIWSNHSCDPNCDILLTQRTIWIVAKRDIKEGEELSYNYGFTAKQYRCQCSANNCCGYILGEEYKQDSTS